MPTIERGVFEMCAARERGGDGDARVLVAPTALVDLYFAFHEGHPCATDEFARPRTIDREFGSRYTYFNALS